MNKITLYFFILMPFLLFAQRIKVVDLETKKPISGVRVSSGVFKNARYTNEKGSVNVTLEKGDLWYEFTINGYQEVGLSASEILALGYVVEMDRLKESLKEVIVSNTKWKENKDKISRSFIQVNRKEIVQTNPQTAADLLQKTGAIHVQKSQSGGGSPFIRGFAANRLLLSVDGVRMNNAIFRGGNLQNVISIDPLSVQNSEVILGAGSVVYGSDAIGGVVNFSTLKPKFSKKDLEISGKGLARISTANNEKTWHADFSLAHKKIGTVTSFSYSDFSDLIQGSNGSKDYLRNEYVTTINGSDEVVVNEKPKKQIASGYQQYNLLQKIQYKPNKAFSTVLSLIYTGTSNFDRYDRLQRKRNDQFRHSEWFYGPQKWLMLSGVISYNKAHSFFDEFKITNAYQRFNESRHVRDFNSLIRSTNKEKVNAYTLNIDARKKWNKSNLSYGVEYVYNNVSSNAYELNILTDTIESLELTRYPNGSKWQSFAGYSTFNFNFNKRLDVSTGLRYNYVLLNADFNSDSLDFPFSEAKISNGAITGGVGTTYRICENLIIKGGFNTAFRAPNIDDVGKTVLDSEPGTLIVPNPDLKSEYAYNTELSCQYTKNKFKLSAAAYYTFLDNALTRDDFELNGESSVSFRGEESQVLAIQNSSNLYIKGLEFRAELPVLTNIKFMGAYTFVRGENTLSDASVVPVRHVSPDFGNMHLKYKKNKWMIDAFVEFSKGFKFEDLAPSEQGKVFIYAQDSNGNPFLPSWYTVNLRSSVILTKRISLNTALENITDQRYRTYSSGISAPGINLVASFNYDF